MVWWFCKRRLEDFLMEVGYTIDIIGKFEATSKTSYFPVIFVIHESGLITWKKKKINK